MKLVKLLILLALAVGIAIPCYAEKVVMEGSTTVLPIAQKAAEVFMQKNPNADISVRGGGSGVGIASIIDGMCDIANSSRPIKDTELDKGVTNGKDIKAHVIAMDGICVIVHPSNSVKALSKKQIKDIYIGSVSNWSQVGGKDEKIVVISRDSSSGTFEAFGTLALEKAQPAEREALREDAAGDRAPEGEHRPDREIDAAGDDDEGHPDRQDDVHRDLVGDVQQIARLSEGVVLRGEGEVEAEDHEPEGAAVAPDEERKGVAELTVPGHVVPVPAGAFIT